MAKCFCDTAKGLRKIKELADYLKIISDENRLKILCLLKDGERCVCHIYEPLDLPQNLISHHLKTLKKAELLHSRKEGKWMFYKRNEEKISQFNVQYLEMVKSKRSQQMIGGQ
ncbi:MAG: ArsR family transcriptional regulator [Actinobacteria bacterium]|nr:MAG: ArsR family transcriptional regulator [Actinomycetota bacterium]